MDKIVKKETALSFENAMDRLEAIVETMENGDVPLAELLLRYEEGCKLLGVCEARLKDAELKIEQLKQRNGTPLLETFPTERDAV